MNDNIKISIITATYNSEKYLENTINSLISQSYQNFEFIIIDGVSTDYTLDIIRRYESQLNGKLKWISEPDNGIYDAWNKGIKMASGEIVGILNSDDEYYKHALEKIIDNWDSETDIYFGNIILVNEVFNKVFKILLKSDKNPDSLKTRMSIQHPSVFVNKKWYKKLLFDTSYKLSSDYDFLLKSYFKSAKFKYINYTFSKMRTGGASDNVNRIIEHYKIKKENSVLNEYSNFLELIKNILYYYFIKYRKLISYSLLSKNKIITFTERKWKKLGQNAK